MAHEAISASTQLDAVLSAIRRGNLHTAGGQATALRRRLEGAAVVLRLVESHTLIDRLVYGAAMPLPSSVLATRVVGYLRVSTDEQAESGAGLKAQEAAIRSEAVRRGWQLVGVHTDAGLSGKSVAGRPALATCLRLVESGKADGLVVAKLDRLSRSLLDFAGLIARANRKGWSLVALDLGVDTTTPAGKLVANVMASVSEWERDVIGQRTKDALAARRDDGVRLGRPTSVSSEVAARIVAARAGGASFGAIARQLNADEVPTSRGGAKWYASTVRSVLIAARAESR